MMTFPGLAVNTLRNIFASRPRLGIFCKFGFWQDDRPVTVLSSRNVACMDPSAQMFCQNPDGGCSVVMVA